MPSTRPFFLTTARLGFSQWSLADLPLAMALWGNLQVTSMIGGPFSASQIYDRLLREIETQRLHQIQYWPLFSLATRDLTGCTGLRPCPHCPEMLELGVHLLPPSWGLGLAHEAAQAAITYAFDTIGARSLISAHHPENSASQRLIAKLGFRFSHRAIYAPTGLEHPYYLLQNPARTG